MRKILFIVGILFLLSIFMVENVGATGAGQQGSGTPSGSGSGATLNNPLGNQNNDIRDIIGNVIRGILGIVGSIALLVFILGGFTWVTSAGNEEKVKKGKDMIYWAALGLAVIFFSYAMLNFVLNAIVGGGPAAPSSVTTIPGIPAAGIPPGMNF